MFSKSLHFSLSTLSSKMKINMALRARLNSYLSLSSGVQMMCAFYYAYQITGGMPVWQIRLLNNYNIWLYGIYSMFINGCVYHCLSKPLYHGTTGIKFQYFAVLLNANQLAAAICFFKAMFTYSPKNAFVIFQVFPYFITLGLGIALNVASWNSVKPKSYSMKGSFLYTRRRDWGIASTIVSAFQLLLGFSVAFMDLMKKDSTTGEISAKPTYGSYFNCYIGGLMIMWIAALGCHVLAFKVSKGLCPCHRILNYITIGFNVFEVIGLILYILATHKAQATRIPIPGLGITLVTDSKVNILYMHLLLFGVCQVVAVFGNSYISWRPFKEDLEYYEVEEEKLGKKSIEDKEDTYGSESDVENVSSSS